MLQDQNTTLELFNESQQTWDECNDFFYHNPTCRGRIVPQSTPLQKACYVYNGADLELLETRLKLQLHIMNAEIDDIILYLVKLRESLKKSRAPPLGTAQREQLWKLIVARFREHALADHGSELIFSRDLQMSNKEHLREYSQQFLKQRQTTYRTESLIPTLRRRIYSHSEAQKPASFRLDSHMDEKPKPLNTLDVVTISGSRWIVSTKRDKKWGIVQHLPAINEIHPYTKHHRFNVPEIRLYEPCIVDEIDGALTRRYEGRKPSYRFDSPAVGIAFQSALRGKVLRKTFQVEEITSGRGLEGTAQPLKLWSDVDNKNPTLSLLVQHSRPFYHIDVPLHIFSRAIYVNKARNNVRVVFPPQRTSRNRKSMNKPRRSLSKLSFLSRSSLIDSSQSSVSNGTRMETSEAILDDDLITDDTRFLASMAHLKIKFSTPGDTTSFEDTLEEHFKVIHCPEPTMDDDFEGPDETTPAYPIPESKNLDYRVRGIKLEYMGSDVLLLLERKLGLEPTVVGRIECLAISHTGESKVAVISLKPRPKALSAPGEDEWIFGPTSEEDDTHITVDTHFRGVTVLYAP
ncbi:hypothetical protein N7486_008702 [Penicillium sp. IBT 16267x]|nr:hypothetical protein N7486_008702 [Penicillium sp. IBT 16267x]